MYNKIRNPINNKYYNINSKIGKSILNKYLNTSILLGGASLEVPASFKTEAEREAWERAFAAQFNSETLMWDYYKAINERQNYFFCRSFCKIIVSFDGNTVNNFFKKLFISYNDQKRIEFINHIFSFFENPYLIRRNIGYYICPNNENVFFYNKWKIKELVECLYDNGIKMYNEESLLILPCSWIKNRKRIENELIHILFGSVDICFWSSDNQLDVPYPLDSMTSEEDFSLKNAYIQFLRIMIG